MLSPAHLCLVLTNSYFHADFRQGLSHGHSARIGAGGHFLRLPRLLLGSVDAQSAAHINTDLAAAIQPPHTRRVPPQLPSGTRRRPASSASSIAITWSFAPVVARRLGASTFLISLLTAAQFAGSIFSFLAAHYLQDKRKMPYMVWAWTISRGLFLLIAFITTPLPFVLIVVAFLDHRRPARPRLRRGHAQDLPRRLPRPRHGLRARGHDRHHDHPDPAVGRRSAGPGRLSDLFPVAAVFGILSSLAFGRIQLHRDHHLAAAAPAPICGASCPRIAAS